MASPAELSRLVDSMSREERDELLGMLAQNLGFRVERPITGIDVEIPNFPNSDHLETPEYEPAPVDMTSLGIEEEDDYEPPAPLGPYEPPIPFEAEYEPPVAFKLEQEAFANIPDVPTDAKDDPSVDDPNALIDLPVESANPAAPDHPAGDNDLLLLDPDAALWAIRLDVDNAVIQKALDLENPAYPVGTYKPDGDDPINRRVVVYSFNKNGRLDRRVMKFTKHDHAVRKPSTGSITEATVEYFPELAPFGLDGVEKFIFHQFHVRGLTSRWNWRTLHIMRTQTFRRPFAEDLPERIIHARFTIPLFTKQNLQVSKQKEFLNTIHQSLTLMENIRLQARQYLEVSNEGEELRPEALRLLYFDLVRNVEKLSGHLAIELFKWEHVVDVNQEWTRSEGGKQPTILKDLFEKGRIGLLQSLSE